MKSRILTAFFALIASLFASLSVAQEYTIRSGDLLRVEVLEDSSINREVLVAPDGRITIPLGGNLRVSGASLPEAARRITSALDDDFATSPTVVVSLLQLREDPVPTPVEEPEPVLYEVYVIGEVNDPGSVSVEPGTTLLCLWSAASQISLRQNASSCVVSRMRVNAFITSTIKMYSMV